MTVNSGQGIGRLREGDEAISHTTSQMCYLKAQTTTQNLHFLFWLVLDCAEEFECLNVVF